jgi:3-deoxy-7-phosphoheptulonate synthase
MVVVMQPGATEEDIARVTRMVEEAGGEAFVSRGKQRTIIGLVGETQTFLSLPLQAMPGVEGVVQIGRPYKLVSAESHPEPSNVHVRGVEIGRKGFTLILGPCAVESPEQTLETARMAKEAGAHILRGGAYKPRTSPYTFQGLGQEGLEILAAAREETGLPVVTEVLETRDVELVAEYADMLQIGARNMQNFSLLKEVGRSGKPVLLKRGFSNTIEEWLLAAEYIAQQGNLQIVLCERGIRTFEPSTRNTLDISAVPVAQSLSHLPVVVDPSHASGKRGLVAPLARAAVAAGADGVMIDIHPEPTRALVDGAQALTGEEAKKLAQDLSLLAALLGRSTQAPVRT